MLNKDQAKDVTALMNSKVSFVQDDKSTINRDYHS